MSSQAITSYPEYQQHIFEIETAITSRLGLRATMDIICKAVVELLGVDHSAILMLEECRTRGVILSEYGEALHTVGSVVPVNDSFAEADLFDNGKPIVAESVATAIELGSVREVLLAQNICSILIVPIRDGKRVVASLGMDMINKRREFSTEDIKKCIEIVSMLSIVIEREQHASKMQRALIDIVSRIERADLLQAIVQHGVDLTQSRDGGIYICNGMRREFHLTTNLGLSGVRLDKIFGPGQGITGDIEKSGQPFLVIPDFRSPRDSSPEIEPIPFESLLAVPIKNDNRILGVLFVESPTGRDYGEMVGTLITVANCAATAIRNANVLQAQNCRLQLLIKTTSILDENKPGSGYESLAQAIMQTLEVSFCRILLMDDNGVTLLPKAHATVTRNHGSDLVFPPDPSAIAVGKSKELLCLLNSGFPRLLVWSNPEDRNNLEKFSQHFKLASTVQSLLMIPLKLGGRVVGLIDVGEMRQVQRQPIRHDQQELLIAIANQVAIIVRRDRHAQLQNILMRLSEQLDGKKEFSTLLQETLRLATTELFPGIKGAVFAWNTSRDHLIMLFPPEKNDVNLLASDPFVGKAAMCNELISLCSTDEWLMGERLFGRIQDGAIVSVPLQAAGEVVAVMVLCDPGGRWLKPKIEPAGVSILERFANRASAALTISQMINPGPRLAEQLARLYPVTDYILKATDLKRVLHTFLTGVTAGYGLRFNRAVVFLVDPSGQYLEGRMAIGDSWNILSDQENDFASFVRALEEGTLPSSEIDDQICLFRIPLKSGSNVLTDVFYGRKWSLLPIEKIGQLPAEFCKIFAPTTELLIGALIGSEPIGVLVVDNKFTKTPITDLDQTILMKFAHRSALAIQNRIESFSAHEHLRLLYEASTLLLISENFSEVAKNSVDRVLLASGGCWVRAILSDELGGIKECFQAGDAILCDPIELIREDRLTQEIIQSRKYHIIEDIHNDSESNTKLYRVEDRALICIPIVLRDRGVGILTIGYSHSKRFSNEEIDALMLFGQKFGISYETALMIASSEQLFDAAHRQPGNEQEYQELLQELAAMAGKRLGAAVTIIWPYDVANKRFVKQGLVIHGLPGEVVNEFRSRVAVPKQVTHLAMAHGHIDVQSIEQVDDAFIDPYTRSLAKQYKITAFQALALKAGDEPIGVIYAAYRNPPAFVPEDRRTAESLANRVALILRNAQLRLEALSARRAASALAEMVAKVNSNDPRQILQFIGQKAHDLLHCDVMVLLMYDATGDRFSYPYFLGGATKHDWPGKEKTTIPHSSWIRSLLTRTEDLVVERVDENPEFNTKMFSLKEGIKTFMAVPLHTADRTVGLVFLNYRDYHYFTDHERANIALVAHEISVAIRNSQLFEERTALEEFAKKLLNCFTVQHIAQAAAEQAARMLGTEFGDVVLENHNGTYSPIGVVGWPDEIRKIEFVKGTGSHTGYTILQNQVVTVTDFPTEDRFTVHEIMHRVGIISGISACLYEDGKPIGALLAHSTRHRNFGEHEGRILCQIANQATAAISGKRQFEHEAERRIKEARTMLTALSAINQQSRGLDPDRIYQKILEEAVRLCEGRAFVATMHRFDADACDLVLEAIYPNTEYERLKDNLSTRWSVKGTNGRIGVTGRAIHKLKPQLVPDVRIDPDYLDFSGETLSELAIPLFDGEVPVGVIDLESREPDAFKDSHLHFVEALAGMIVIVMRNARDYETMKETITRLDARTALAWIGMIANHWRHTLQNAAVAIRNHLELFKLDLKEYFSESIPVDIAQRLQNVEELVSFIKEKPVTPPLSSEEGLAPVRLNALIRERAEQLWDNRDYRRDIKLELQMHAADSATVQTSQEWLIRAIDIVIDNAVKELQHPEVASGNRVLKILTRMVPKDGVEIVFQDSGRGIPQSIKEQLFRGVVKKAKGETGLGIGMLMAKMIVETYAGKLQIGDSAGSGTSIVMWLPRV
jgi:GAF domain-containing protein